MNKLTLTSTAVPSRFDEVAGYTWTNSTCPNSFGGIPTAWAYATSGVYNYGKMVTSGGGCSTAIARGAWPARIKDKVRYASAVHPSR